MKTALSIAGSDSSGGAGIQADLKTMAMNGVFAMSAITALTAQNTTGVSGILEVTPEFLQQQVDAVFEDIRPDAVKIGMVSSVALIETTERVRSRKYCCGSGYGGNQWGSFNRRGCHCNIKGKAIATCNASHSKCVRK